MTCDSPLRSDVLSALKAAALGRIEEARINAEIYLHNPVGIGEHPDVLAAVKTQLDVIAEERERIEVIDQYFLTHKHSTPLIADTEANPCLCC